MKPERKTRPERSQMRRNQPKHKTMLHMVKKLKKNPAKRITTNKRTSIKNLATQLLSKRQKLNPKNKKEKVKHLIKIKKGRTVNPNGDGEAEDIERDMHPESGEIEEVEAEMAMLLLEEEIEVIEATEEERAAIDLTLAKEMKITKDLSLFKIRKERAEVAEAEVEEAEEHMAAIIEVEEEAEETEVAEAVPTRRMAASREEADPSREEEDLPAAKQMMKETNKHLLNRLLKSKSRRMPIKMMPQPIMNEDAYCWGNIG